MKPLDILNILVWFVALGFLLIVGAWMVVTLMPERNAVNESAAATVAIAVMLFCYLLARGISEVIALFKK